MQYVYRACSMLWTGSFSCQMHQNKIIESGNLHVFKIIVGINFQKAIEFSLFRRYNRGVKNSNGKTSL